jgi:hypothetical protein
MNSEVRPCLDQVTEKNKCSIKRELFNVHIIGMVRKVKGARSGLEAVKIELNKLKFELIQTCRAAHFRPDFCEGLLLALFVSKVPGHSSGQNVPSTWIRTTEGMVSPCLRVYKIVGSFKGVWRPYIIHSLLVGTQYSPQGRTRYSKHAKLLIVDFRARLRFASSAFHR